MLSTALLRHWLYMHAAFVADVLIDGLSVGNRRIDVGTPRTQSTFTYHENNINPMKRFKTFLCIN